MITNFLSLEIDNIDLDNMWFQMEGATCHTSHATMDVLHVQFLDMVISLGGDMNLPPRSCDLTPLEILLNIFIKRPISHKVSAIFSTLFAKTHTHTLLMKFLSQKIKRDSRK